MKKTISFGIVLTLMLTAISIAPNTLASDQENPFITDLIAGKYMDVGDIEVWDNGTTLFVKYIIDLEDWVMNESHVHIGFSLDDFPLTKSGNPKVGHFINKTEHNPSVTEYTYEIPYNGETLIATHAALWNSSCETDCTIEMTSESCKESAWGNGTQFPGRNWAMYFEYSDGYLNNNAVNRNWRFLRIFEFIRLKTSAILERINMI